jgi:long-subunit fatty acid transport protein
MQRFVAVVRVFTLALLVAPLPALAQTNSELNAGIQFDFSLPGARSLSLGGAFVALADDATAAWGNPAGLTILTRPEISAEGRFWNFNNLITDRGHNFGSPTNIGFDNIAGLVNAESESWTQSLAFLSYVHPTPRWTFGAYRHQVSNFDAEIQSSGPFLDRPGDVDRVEPFRGTMELDIVNYGASAAIRVNQNLSLGAGVTFDQFSIDSRTARAIYVPFTAVPPAQRPLYTNLGQKFGPPDFSEGNVLLDVSESGTDWATGFDAGVIWRAPRWSAGAAYRYGPTFQYDATTIVGPGGAKEPFYVPFVGTVFDTEQVDFNLPDTFAVGFTVKPLETLVISFEYDRVRYSELSENTAEVFGIEEHDPDPANAAAVTAAIRNDLNFPDANQIRFGAEYAIARPSGAVLLRLGGWFDPDHRMQYTGAPEARPRLATLWRPGEDEFHVAPGVGFAFQKFQIDAALDISERVNTVSFSTVYRF